MTTIVFIGVLSFLILFIIILNVYKRYKNQELIKSVTSLNRGTNSELNLILKLLKSGINSKTIFHDLIIKKENDKFSQVDIVIATTQGIIVIEVKDYSGWIFGNGNQTNWTQVMAYGKRKYRFYNPIKQVKSQISSLKNSLKQFDKIPFFSIIVFYGDCTLKEINYVPKGTFIVKSHRILEALNSIKANNEQAPYENKQEVVDTLKGAVLNGANKDYHRQHIDNIKNIVGKHRILD
jgi:hypothetical protein|tara:strand:- start:256 stop:963 length:708 start_codon:yes stop_codon:yes gene_type:complete